MYKVVEGKPIKVGNKLVNAFQVVDETGAVKAQEHTRARADIYIKVLEVADKADADAAEQFNQKHSPK